MKFCNLLIMSFVLISECNGMFDGFDQLSSKWVKNKSPKANISVNTKRGVLILSGLENHFNYVERKLDIKDGSVQVDVNPGNDFSASWAPSFLLYWNSKNYLRVMVNPTYGLKIISNVDGLVKVHKTREKIHAASWYRVRADMTNSGLSLYFSSVDSNLKKVLTISRCASWRDAPVSILGKGYMGKKGFANSYSKHGKKYWVEFDNFVAGDVNKYIKQINEGINQRILKHKVSSETLKTAFWPQQTKQGEKVKTLWVVPGEYQRLSILYANFDSVAFAENTIIEISVPKKIGIRQITFGIDDEIKIKRKEEKKNILFSVSRKTNWKLSPGLHGYDPKNKKNPGWSKWPRRIFPELAVYFIPQKGVSGKEIKARLVCDNATGKWTKLDIKEMPPLPTLLKYKGKGADLTAHILDVPITGSNKYREDILKGMLENAKRLGFKFIISSTKAESILSKSIGLVPLLGSNPWWHYLSQCSNNYKPNSNEKASVVNTRGSNFCPVIIANGQGTYGKFLKEVTRKTANSGAEGFFLDYECKMPLCYCERCRKAFIDYTGNSDVKWPSEVKTNAKYYDSWISFRCWQGALYVKAIRDAVWKALPGCPLRAWVAGYNYRNSIKTAHIDVSKAAQFLTEVETPHYSLPYSYDDRIKLVEEGIETVKDTVAVVNIPVIFCSSIDYPVGHTMWSDPDILDAQIMAVIGEGAQGVSFWGGHFQGAIDGKFMHKLVKWHNLLVSSVKYLKNGKREDKLLNITGNKNRLYSSLRVLDNKALVILVNLSKQKKDLIISVPGFKLEGDTLPYKRKRINLSKVTLKPLEGVFIELKK
jgi:hypothetical protein